MSIKLIKPKKVEQNSASLLQPLDNLLLQEKMQVLLMANNFRTSKFVPLTKEIPHILQPICGIPAVEYTLHWLQMNGYREVNIVVCNDPETEQQLMEYFKPKRKLTINIIHSINGKSMGDALRDVYLKQTIQEDFLLIYGDMITNVNLKEAERAHMLRRKQNPMNILTCLYRKILANDPISQNLEEDYFHIIDHSNNQLIHLQNMKGQS